MKWYKTKEPGPQGLLPSQNNFYTNDMQFFQQYFKQNATRNNFPSIFILEDCTYITLVYILGRQVEGK